MEKIISDGDALRIIADNIDGFWGALVKDQSAEEAAEMLRDPEILKHLKEDAAKLQEIANAR